MGVQLQDGTYAVYRNGVPDHIGISTVSNNGTVLHWEGNGGDKRDYAWNTGNGTYYYPSQDPPASSKEYAVYSGPVSTPDGKTKYFWDKYVRLPNGNWPTQPTDSGYILK